MSRIESSIISNLINNEEYARKVIPHLKKEYFMDKKEALVASIITTFFDKYNKSASKEIIAIELENSKGISDKELAEYTDYIAQLEHSESNLEWLVNETENFCKSRSVYNAVVQSIKIIEGKDNNFTQDALPSILSEALAVSFDNSIGHDYLIDADARYDFYHKQEERIPFDLELMNKITKGGLPKKTLSVVMAGSGVGKSIFLCHCAANILKEGKNVLYITLEMAEERIAERIDANLLNVSLTDLQNLDKETFSSKVSKVSKKTQGKLIIKEYPTSSAHAGHFRALIEELKIKKGFIPDFICIDYINICASQRIKGGSDKTYTYVKAIAEEIRGLAVEYNVPILSATQINRGGMSSSDPGMEDTSESIGLPQTVDMLFALIGNEELDNLNQIIVKQIKNRYNDVNYFKRFVLGLDKSKMRFYNVESSAQENVSDSGQPKYSPDTVKKPKQEGSYNGFKF
jgi:replicative DNA helicase